MPTAHLAKRPHMQYNGSADRNGGSEALTSRTEIAGMNIAYFDCFSGAGGDMIVASLLDAGADADALREGLATLGLDGYALDIDKVTKQGLAATRFTVQLDPHKAQPHRHLADIEKILQGASLPDRIRDKALEVFTRLAEAEASVHGTTIDKIHFHEVGAVDAMVDVTAAVLALDQLGVESVVASAIPTGSGTVACDHGVLPVPAPATAELLRGVPLAACDEVGELITPTAAAILRTQCVRFGTAPPMTIDRIGYGAGTREGHRRPNVVRVLIGQATDEIVPNPEESDRVTVLETNLDDVSPEIVGHTLDRLFDAGVLDAFAVPIHMKKSRLGLLLTAICRSDQVAAIERLIFTETPTFGIRRRVVERSKLRRRLETVTTAFGPIRIKVGECHGSVTTSPEYEDCRKAAAEHGVALREVIAAANAAWASGRTA